jgi:CheY-like chemotaxis protein
MPQILVVDDNFDASAVLARLLRYWGHEPVCFTDPFAALEWLNSQRPDLLLLDMMMPGMNGLEMLQRVRQLYQSRDLPIVMYSAVADAGAQRESLAGGADQYWVKASMGFDEMERRLSAFFGGKSDADVPKPH